MKLIFKNSFIILFTSLILNSCDMSSDMQSKGNYISGHLNFIDTNFTKTGGHYAVALYLNQNSPFSEAPILTQVINPDVLNKCCYYRIYWDGKGNCIVSAIWVSDSNKSTPLVLGAFGCDTARACTNPNLISFPNYTGADYLFSCWADTTKKFN